MTTIIKKPVIHKTFRLLDFHIYDEMVQSGGDSSSDDGSVDSDAKTKADAGKFVIQMFGINESGETCSFFVSDYQPFFFMKVGDQWNQGNVTQLSIEIKQKIGRYYEDAIVSATLVEFNKLYGFSAGKKHKFAKFVFKSQSAFNKVRGLWYQYIKTDDGRNDRKPFPLRSQGVTLELYESTIPPLLRYFHIQNVSPSGWVSIPLNKVTKPPIKTTTCTYEFICKCSSITPLPDKETRVPYKICSFDIEASSSHGDFPLPQKTYKRLAMNMVDVFSAHFRAQPLTLEQSTQLCKKIVLAAFGHGKCDDIDLVYPQIEPSKQRVTQILNTVLETPLDHIKSLKLADDDNSELLTIDSIFEKIKDEFQQTADGGGAIDDDSDGEADEGDVAQWTPPVVKATNKPAKTLQKPAKITIVELLMNQDQSREMKVQVVNEILTLQFPRLKGDEVTFIGSTFMRYGEAEPYLNHCLVVGTCDPVEGVVIETATTERDLLLQWTDVIQRENPDIIIGYNIFGFDYEFMFRRAQELHCERDFLLLSRKMGEFCAKESKGVDGNRPEVSIENTKIQLASGEYDLRYFKMTGRLQIDMYSYFRRDFNLPSYKLDDVAGQFISDDVKKIVLTTDPTTNNPITQLYSQNLMGLHVGDFIHIEIGGFTSDYYRDGKKFVVQDIQKGVTVTETVKEKEVTTTYNVIVLNGHEDVTKAANGKAIKWGMAKDDVTPQDIFRLAKESSAGRAIVAKYCIQDCNLVHHLMNKIDVLTGYVEMSRICSVPISFLIFRGQGIKLTSYVAKKCRDKDTLMPDLDKSGSNEGYEGAIVLPPKCSMYMDNPVACVDYASLYPSSMISQNFSHDSKVWSKEYDLDGNLVGERGEKDPKTGKYIYDNLPGFEYIDIEFDNFAYRRNPLKPAAKAVKTKIGKLVCRWAQFPENRKGIMPAILEELLKARATTRKQAKTEKDPFMQNILDKRQLGYKVTANSLYGQCGAKTSTFYEKDVAACTTATGRMMITYAKRIIEEVYGDRVYETAIHGPVRTKAEYVYGDSVAHYTPVYVRIFDPVSATHSFDIITITQLAEKYGNNQWIKCIEEGKQDKEYCELQNIESWTEKGWTKLFRVIRHELASHKKMMRILTHTGVVDVTDDHSLLLPSGAEISPKDVEVGQQLLHTPIPFQMGRKIMPEMKTTFDINRDQLEMAKVCAFIQSYHSYIKIEPTQQPDVYHIKTLIDQTSHPNTILKIHEIPYSGFVYDLTTENHHFAAGVGNMIVHNTDSVFFTFNLENPQTGEKIRGKPALEMTIEIAQDAADLCTQFLKPPMELTYEKTLMPFILLSKKRYVGMLYETDANKGKLKYMGLSLKRRDSCDYLKDVYGGILNILMKENSVQKAIEFLDKALKELIDGTVSMDKLMITKALRSDYKNPQQIAHRVLADRIGQRDPGNKPKPGDRMKFVHIVTGLKKALQGDKIETPEFILSQKLAIDYEFYITNQLMKPLQQLFGLALEQIWLNQNKHSSIKTFKKDMAALHQEVGGDIEIFMKKKEKYCSAKIKAILFDKFLTQIAHKKAGLQTITSMFAPRSNV